MDLQEKILNLLQKAGNIEYLNPGQRPPPGVVLHQGPRGGTYYEVPGRGGPTHKKNVESSKDPLYEQGNVETGTDPIWENIDVSTVFPELEHSLPKFKQGLTEALKSLPPKHLEELRFIIDKDLVDGRKLAQYIEGAAIISKYANKADKAKVSESYHNEIDATPWKIIVLHEIGHHVHKSKYFYEWNKLSRTDPEGGSTEYAKEGPEERFAEAYVYYLTNGEALEKRDKLAYSFLKDTVFEGKDYAMPVIKGIEDQEELPEGSYWIEDYDHVAQVLSQQILEESEKSEGKDEEEIAAEESSAGVKEDEEIEKAILVTRGEHRSIMGNQLHSYQHKDPKSLSEIGLIDKNARESIKRKINSNPKMKDKYTGMIHLDPADEKLKGMPEGMVAAHELGHAKQHSKLPQNLMRGRNLDNEIIADIDAYIKRGRRPKDKKYIIKKYSGKLPAWKDDVWKNATPTQLSIAVKQAYHRVMDNIKKEIDDNETLDTTKTSSKYGYGTNSPDNTQMNTPAMVRKDFGGCADGSTPTYGGGGYDKIKSKIDKIMAKAYPNITPTENELNEAKDTCGNCAWKHPDTCKNCSSKKVEKAAFAPDATDENQKPIKIANSVDNQIEEEAQPKEPKTKLQEKIIGNVEHFEKDLINSFLLGYEKTALRASEMDEYDMLRVFNLAKEVNIQKGFNIDIPEDSNDKLEQVVFIDTIAHTLHQDKYPDGRSRYKKLDTLADLAKSVGETNRDDRLILLNSPIEARNKLENMGIEILCKGRIFDKSMSYWKIFEKSIKEGINNLSNDELILLREWMYSKV